MEENKERFYQSIGRVLIIAGIAILISVAAFLLFGKVKLSGNYRLVYEKNITFNNFDMYVYKLEYCIGNVCTGRAEEYICTAKVVNNTKCVILPTQLVCERGVVCYPLRGIFTNP